MVNAESLTSTWFRPMERQAISSSRSASQARPTGMNMPVGRAWEALREDEIACRSMGLNHVLVKLSAFTIGASTAGLAGVFFATYQGFVNPTSFTFFESALILAIVVLGGMGSTIGVVIAAFVLTVAPELLRSFAEYRVLLFGILMVLMMIWRPRGLIRISRTGVKPRKGVLITERAAP